MVWRWLSLALLVGAVAAAAVQDPKARFDGFRVYRVVPTTQQQVEFLKELGQQDHVNYNFWTQPVLNGTVDIMVSPYLRTDFRDLAHALGLDAKVFIQDVQKLIDEENPKGRLASGFDWTAYYPLANIEAWYETLATTYSDRVEIINIGKSYENRDIKVIKISLKKEGSKAVFVESGIHAREWITVATSTYLINELLTSKDKDIQSVAENFDWYILPSINPDGYAYTHNVYRMWRKTRSPGPEGRCYGTDGNRNFAYKWDNPEGASTDECEETYKGRDPFSEPETVSLKNYLEKLKEDILVYFCIHSYSQVLMIPYGIENSWAPDEEAQKEILLEMSEQAVNILAQRHKTKYGIGEIFKAIKYDASGGSMDWVKNVLDVKYTFEWELRDTGRYGFLLPASQIVDTADETIDSMVFLLQDVLKREKEVGGGDEDP